MTPIILNHEKLERLYREGKTIREISEALEVSRNTIWRGLKEIGLTKKDGGAHINHLAKLQKAKEKMDRYYLKRYGMVKADFKRLSAIGAVRAFTDQKRNAGVRGIPWKFNLKTWWEVWEESGKFSQRGKGLGKYCMSRPGDVGPYEPGNVKIITIQANSIEGIHGYWQRIQGDKSGTTIKQDQAVYRQSREPIYDQHKQARKNAGFPQVVKINLPTFRKFIEQAS